jgi:hypothetical protein
MEILGLATLIITDLDAKNSSDVAVPPRRGQGLTSRNETLKKWVPACSSIDELLDKEWKEKEIRLESPSSFGVRVAYQIPVMVEYVAANGEALPNTFEDALVFQNIELFRNRGGTGLSARVKEAIERNVSLETLGEDLFRALKSGTKAEFALDLLEIEDPLKLKVPRYIDEGLTWLAAEIDRRRTDVTAIPTLVEAVP